MKLTTINARSTLTPSEQARRVLALAIAAGGARGGAPDDDGKKDDKKDENKEPDPEDDADDGGGKDDEDDPELVALRVENDKLKKDADARKLEEKKRDDEVKKKRDKKRHAEGDDEVLKEKDAEIDQLRADNEKLKKDRDEATTKRADELFEDLPEAAQKKLKARKEGKTPDQWLDLVSTIHDALGGDDAGDGGKPKVKDKPKPLGGGRNDGGGDDKVEVSDEAMGILKRLGKTKVVKALEGVKVVAGRDSVKTTKDNEEWAESMRSRSTKGSGLRHYPRTDPRHEPAK